VTDAAGNVTSYGYDSLDRLTSAVQRNAGGAQLASYAYTYDPVDNMTSKTVNGVTTSWSYNAADELTTASYDANGNETQSPSGLTLAYNAKDQTTSITPSRGTAIGMTYRGGDQAQRVTAGGNSYQYDSTGLSQVTTPSVGLAYLTTTPGGAVLSERLSSGTYYYLHDGLGSVVGLTNSAGTALSNSYSYDPYGNATSASEGVSNSFRFIGAIWDSQTGLYKMGERYYDPTVGRFTQTDPLGGGYTYASGDPANLTDPSGLCPVCVAAPALAIPGVGEVIAGVVVVAAVAYAGYKVGEMIHTALSEEKTVGEILKGKKGSIKNAPLPPGSPSWDEIEKLTWREIESGAKQGKPGYRTIKKLLSDKRFNK
jgi:RHS repeat-associated protein